MKGDCRFCNQLGVQPLLSFQAPKMIASPWLLKVLAERPALMPHRALRGSRFPLLHWADVPLGSPLDVRCVSTPVPFLLIHELVLRLVSGDTIHDWLGWADGREELSVSFKDWHERIDMSLRGPFCAVFSTWCDTARYHTGSKV